jgi:hypothetical protein
MNEKTPKSDTRKEKEDVETFTDEEHAEAYLLAGFPTKRGEWSDGMGQTIANVRSMSLFFCPAMRVLKGRGNTIQRLCQQEEHSLPAVTRRPFNDLSSGESTTFEAILQVDRILKLIASHKSTKVRAATKVSIGGRMRPFTLPENSVIPSYVWINYPLISEYRKQFGDIGRTRMAQILFGDEYGSFFHSIEDGEKRKGIVYDYRITMFTADLILIALKTIYEAFPEARGGKFDEEPRFEQFFDTSHTAGLGAYKKTKPLPSAAGNMQRSASTASIQRLKERAIAYATKFKEQADKKTKEKEKETSS